MVVLLTVVATIAIVVVLGGLAVWFGHHSLSSGGPTSSGGNALGGFDAFDPGRARMQEDLDSKETEGAQFPADDGDERPVRVDLHTGKVHIRKPTEPPTV